MPEQSQNECATLVSPTFPFQAEAEGDSHKSSNIQMQMEPEEESKSSAAAKNIDGSGQQYAVLSNTSAGSLPQNTWL